MTHVAPFVPETACNVPQPGSIYSYSSLLSLPRIPCSISWLTFSGYSKHGPSLFYPNDGLDDGDLLLQPVNEIGPDDTLSDGYRTKILPTRSFPFLR